MNILNLQQLLDSKEQELVNHSYFAQLQEDILNAIAQQKKRNVPPEEQVIRVYVELKTVGETQDTIHSGQAASVQSTASMGSAIKKGEKVTVLVGLGHRGLKSIQTSICQEKQDESMDPVTI